MTFGELFREVSAEFVPVDEISAKYADSVAPGWINKEVPTEQVEKLREMFRSRAKRINLETPEQTLARLIKHLSNN